MTTNNDNNNIVLNNRNDNSSTQDLEERKKVIENKKKNLKHLIMMDNLLNEMATRQLKNIQQGKRMQYNDLRRVYKHIDDSIFNKNNCCLWRGYITNDDDPSKGTYINFYFNGKKIALHRLLYQNFVGNVTKNEYLKFTCENKGKCCNINHLEKHKYNKKEKIKQPKKMMEEEVIDDNNFTIFF